MRRLPVFVLALSMLGGCSTYTYRAEVDQLAGGVDALRSGYREGLAGAATDQERSTRIAWVAGRQAFNLAPACAVSGLGPCVLLPAGGVLPPALPDATAKIRALEPQIDALAGYAAALRAITNEADRKAFDAAVGDLATKVSAFVTAVGGVAGGIPAFAGPAAGAVVRIAGEIVGDVLDAERLAELKRAVDKAEPAVAKLAQEMGGQYRDLAVVRRDGVLANLMALAQQTTRGVDEASYAARYDTARSMAATITALDDPNVASAAAGLATAHAALAKALRDDSRQADSLVAAIKRFADAAKALRDAMKASS